MMSTPPAKKLVVIALTCLTTSLYAHLGDDYDTCLKQLEKTGVPVHQHDVNGYPSLQASSGGMRSVTLYFNKARTHCIVEENISPSPIQVNLMKETLAGYHKHWKIDNVDDSNVWAESTDGEIYAMFSLKGPGVYRITNREGRQSPLVRWPDREPWEGKHALSVKH